MDEDRILNRCNYCNKAFFAKTEREKYCSPSCRNCANVIKSRNKKKALEEQNNKNKVEITENEVDDLAKNIEKENKANTLENINVDLNTNKFENILEKIDKQIIKNVRERSIDIQKYEGGEDDMKNEKRKQAIYEYKEKKTTGGVYKITNTESKKSLIKGEIDLASMQNRFNFSVSVNSCLNIKLQKDWNKYGAKSFTFEILEETEMKPEMDRREFKKYLNEMAEKYTENMDPEELY